MSGAGFNPSGDPAVLERGGAAWGELASVLSDVRMSLDVAVDAALETWTGPAATAFWQWWKTGDGMLASFTDATQQMESTLCEAASAVADANAAWHAQCAMLIAEVNAAALAIAANPMHLMLAPGIVAAMNAAAVMLIEHTSQEVVAGVSAALLAVETAVASAVAAVAFPPSSPAILAAGTTLTAAVNTLFNSVVISIQVAVAMVQAAIEALIAAVMTFVVGMVQRGMTHAFVDGSPFAGWTVKEAGEMAIEVGIAGLPVGFVVRNAKPLVQLGTELAQNVGEQFILNTYNSGDPLDGWDSTTIVSMGTGMAAGAAANAVLPSGPASPQGGDVDGPSPPFARPQAAEQVLPALRDRLGDQTEARPRVGPSLQDRLGDQPEARPRVGPSPQDRLGETQLRAPGDPDVGAAVAQDRPDAAAPPTEGEEVSGDQVGNGKGVPGAGAAPLPDRTPEPLAPGGPGGGGDARPFGTNEANPPGAPPPPPPHAATLRSAAPAVFTDWRSASALRGRRRSPALKRIDAAVAGYADARARGDDFVVLSGRLRELDRAITNWEATKRAGDGGVASERAAKVEELRNALKADRQAIANTWLNLTPSQRAVLGLRLPENAQLRDRIDEARGNADLAARAQNVFDELVRHLRTGGAHYTTHTDLFALTALDGEARGLACGTNAGTLVEVFAYAGLPGAQRRMIGQKMMNDGRLGSHALGRDQFVTRPVDAALFVDAQVKGNIENLPGRFRFAQHWVVELPVDGRLLYFDPTSGVRLPTPEEGGELGADVGDQRGIIDPDISPNDVQQRLENGKPVEGRHGGTYQWYPPAGPGAG